MTMFSAMILDTIVLNITLVLVSTVVSSFLTYTLTKKFGGHRPASSSSTQTVPSVSTINETERRDKAHLLEKKIETHISYVNTLLGSSFTSLSDVYNFLEETFSQN
jgi:hypothetical protein